MDKNIFTGFSGVVKIKGKSELQRLQSQNQIQIVSMLLFKRDTRKEERISHS